MPSSRVQATQFLETQWSSITENKIKGILAELRFRNYLDTNGHQFVPGGWIIVPGNPSLAKIPAHEKICLLPRKHTFSWEAPAASSGPTLAEIAAYNYFNQVGMRTLFAEPTAVVESSFSLPQARNGSIRASYPRSYQLELKEISGNQFLHVAESQAFSKFPPRTTGQGMRVYEKGRIDPTTQPWSDNSAVSDLFWFEYTRYYFQHAYIVSNNDLDLFVRGASGRSYPVEVKSKSPSADPSLGSWFGIDAGPFAKLSFFTSNSMSNDALYVVEELDTARNHVDWLGIRFTDLVKSCSWVVRSGGRGMTGGSSSTYKIPKAAFTPLGKLMPLL